MLKDAENWLADIGLGKAPDHATLHRAAAWLLRATCVNRLLDAVARWASQARLLGLSTKPLTMDSTVYESHHVSRHYEKRCHQTRKRMRRSEWAKRGRHRTRSQTVRGLPKLAIAVPAACHLVLSYWTGTGAGSDHPHFKPLLAQARARVPHRRLKSVQDAGYDSEANHVWARGELGVQTVTPPWHGRPRQDGLPPGGYWRRRMVAKMRDLESRRACGYNQRVQCETVNSMMKRNCSSELRGATAWSRKRDMALKVITHDAMIL